ncbi:MAG: hypothetical protein M5U26_13255 [Planctomycetota bacterium]|nr:hypothetical protein [Planctomycetota bacterium]
MKDQKQHDNREDAVVCTNPEVGRCDYACATHGCHGAPDVCLAADYSSLPPYEARVARMRDDETEAYRQVLVYHHDLGRFATTLEKDKQTYGKRTLKEFAHALQRDPADIRAAKAFYEKYSLENLEEAINQGISWDTIKLLVQVSDDAQRADLQAKFAAGELLRIELESKVKRLLRNRLK